MPVPVEEGIFTWPSEQPRLLGSRCRRCGTYAFPAHAGCQRCTAVDAETVELAPRGTLWTWTVQAFPPKSPPYLGDVDPATFEPYGVGYVELPEQVRVEARLTEADPARLTIGMPMELVIVPLGSGDAERVTFAFRPVDIEAPAVAPA